MVKTTIKKLKNSLLNSMKNKRLKSLVKTTWCIKSPLSYKLTIYIVDFIF